MDKLMDKVYEHPIITIILTSSIMNGIASIIYSIRGVPKGGSKIYITTTEKITKGQ